MAVNETIVTGRKFRKLIDETNKLWQRISFWTKSSDVEFDDGKSAETKVGAIDGITSDLSGESENIAASIKCVNELNNNLPQFIYDSTGKITGYKTLGGADTVFPFKSDISFLFYAKDSVDGTDQSYNMNYYLEFDIANYSSIEFKNVSISGTRSKNYLYVYFDGEKSPDYSILRDTSISLVGHESIKICATGKRTSAGSTCNGSVKANIMISK